MRPIARFYSRLRIVTSVRPAQTSTAKEYADQLSDINRVSGMDVAPGERIPGYGRSYFAPLQLRYK